MSDNDDLDALTSALRGRRGKAGDQAGDKAGDQADRPQSSRDQAPQPAQPTQPAGPKGLNPLDVLGLPPAQRELVNWLARRKQARFDEIQQALGQGAGQDAVQVEQTLSALQAAGYVQLLLQEGEVFFSVVFRGTVSRAGRGLSGDIWKVLDQDNVSFLEQTALFHGLPRLEIERLASQLEERHFSRNEVIVWQGGVNEGLYLIKHGLVEITHLCPNGQVEKLDYLKPGDVLGEVSFITQLSCTATATALSQVYAVRIQPATLNDLLTRYSSVAIELARIMGQRLSSTTARLAHLTAETRLCALVGVRHGAGCTTLGAALALALAQMSEGRTAYTEYPTPNALPALLSPARENGVYAHPGGYDVLVLRDDPGWPPNVRATLMLDQLRQSYTNVVASLPDGVGDRTAYWLEQADQVILVTPPDEASAKSAEVLRTRWKAMARPDGATWFTVVNHTSRTSEASGAAAVAGQAEFDVPFLPDLPPLAELRLDNLPAPLAQTVQALASRLGRTYWIGIYVPSTMGVNLHADTRDWLEKTLAFMGQLFGGATSHQAQGVWGSQSADLVSETISIVRSYVTQSDLDRHLPAVIEYAESLKQAMKQEAMAIEVNQRLMLI